MTTFSLPRTLVAGTPENVNHVQENFVAVRDHINGNLDATNFGASAKPATLLAPHNTISEAVSQFNDGDAAGRQFFGGEGLIADASVVAFNVPFQSIFHFSSSRYQVTGLTPKLHLFGGVYTNNLSPGITFSYAMRTISAVDGSADSFRFTMNPTEVAGSNVNIAPINNQRLASNSGDFTAPFDDHYALTVTLSGNVPAGAMGYVWTMLTVRWV